MISANFMASGRFQVLMSSDLAKEITDDLPGREMDMLLSTGEQVGRPITKAWNSIGSDSFAKKGTPAGSPERITLPVASDHERDRKFGMALVEDTGFDAFDAGTLAESWRQQPGAPSYCTDLTRKELPAALAAAERARLPKRRDLSVAAVYERIGDGTKNPDAEYAFA